MAKSAFNSSRGGGEPSGGFKLPNNPNENATIGAQSALTRKSDSEYSESASSGADVKDLPSFEREDTLEEKLNALGKERDEKLKEITGRDALSNKQRTEIVNEYYEKQRDLDPTGKYFRENREKDKTATNIFSGILAVPMGMTFGMVAGGVTFLGAKFLTRASANMASYDQSKDAEKKLGEPEYF